VANFPRETRETWVAPKLLFRRDMTDPKIKALNKAAIRTAEVGGPEVFAVGLDHPVAARFIKLIKAKNRRVRVQMRRAALSPRNSPAYFGGRVEVNADGTVYAGPLPTVSAYPAISKDDDK